MPTVILSPPLLSPLSIILSLPLSLIHSLSPSIPFTLLFSLVYCAGLAAAVTTLDRSEMLSLYDIWRMRLFHFFPICHSIFLSFYLSFLTPSHPALSPPFSPPLPAS